jgi:hypothetical protein
MLKIDRSSYIIWGILGSVISFVFLRKWGLLGGYLQASPFIYLGLSFFITFKLSKVIDSFVRTRFVNFTFPWIYKVGKSLSLYLIFFVLIYISYFSTMDRIIISKISNTPIEILLPCTYRPNPPELEVEIRKVWRMHKFDSIDDFCNRAGDASGADN